HGHRRGAGGHGLGRFLHIHQAHAAVGGDGQLLVVAEVRDVGTGLFGRMHHHAARRDFDLLAVEFDFNHVYASRRVQAACPVVVLAVSLLIMAANSWRKCLSMARTGMAAASPSAQMVRPMMFSATLSSRSMSAGVPSPRWILSTRRQSQPVPSRQGVHWPQDSCM